MEPRRIAIGQDFLLVAQEKKSGKFRLGSRPELDGIRGLSVLAVMAWHVAIPFVKAGNIGVDVFFVLSGFLITTLLLQEWDATGTISLKNFYIRRGLRLFPALFVLMFLYASYATVYEAGVQQSNSYKYIGATLFYVANWVQVIGGLHHPVLGHTWSLSIEEQFYVVYPVLLLGLLRLRITHRGVLIIFGLAIASVWLNRFWLWNGPDSYDRLHMSLDTRADALLIGSFVSVLVVNGWVPKKVWATALMEMSALCSALLLGALVICGIENETYYKYGVVSVTAVCVGLVLMDLMGQPMKLTQRLLQFSPLAWTGRISYGLYLWHIPVFALVGRNDAWSGVRVQGTRFMAVFLVASISYYLIERPFLGLKSKFLTDRLVGEVELHTLTQKASVC